MVSVVVAVGYEAGLMDLTAVKDAANQGNRFGSVQHIWQALSDSCKLGQVPKVRIDDFVYAMVGEPTLRFILGQVLFSVAQKIDALLRKYAKNSEAVDSSSVVKMTYDLFADSIYDDNGPLLINYVLSGIAGFKRSSSSHFSARTDTGGI